MQKDWDSAYASGNTPWDKGTASPPLLEYLENHRISGRVLVPGCGTGHDAVLLSKAGAEVIGMDIAPRALRVARQNPAGAAVRWLEGDFLDLGQVEAGHYDWVVEHTCLCAIEPRQREAYVDSLRQALKPGGHYWAVFFCEVSAYDGSGPPHPIKAPEIDSLFAGGFELMDSYTPQETYPSRPVGHELVRVYRKS
jgi:SAM-dependent methyltransferase